MITHTFQLKITGPASSGKSTFIKFIKEACANSVSWAAVGTGPHALNITNIRPPIPDDVLKEIGQAVEEVKET